MKNSKDGIIEKQLSEGVNTIRTQMTLLTQIVTIILLCNISVIGYALNSSKYHLIAFGSVFPILILFVRHISYRLMLPFFYCTYKIENESESEDNNFIVLTYVRVAEITLSKEFDRIINLKDKFDRIAEIKKLKSIKYSSLMSGNIDVTILCFVVSLIQLAFVFWRSEC
ncbi:MAG: hypothetical protein IPG79_14830 [Saprospiraceae bacterium]|nr:hypothetical protein [Saprospiraceae bacterium]